MKSSVLIIFVVFSGIIVGCYSDTGDPPRPLYQGVWKSPCVVVETGLGESYAQVTYDVEGDSAEHSLWFYTDETCSVFNFSGTSDRSEPKLIGTLSKLNETQSTSVGVADKIDIDWHTSTWIENGELMSLDTSELNQVSRTIWLLQNGTLYIGDMGAVSSLISEERPTILDIDFPLTRG